MSTCWGDINSSVSTHGYSLVYGTDVSYKNDIDGKLEFLFIYDSLYNQDKLFDLNSAIEDSRCWWSLLYGSDAMEVVDAIVLGQVKTRTWFLIYVIPLYKYKGQLVRLSQTGKLK